MSHKNLGGSIRKGVKWLVVGNLGTRILDFAFGVALARLLVPADFGMIVTIQAFTGFVGMITTGGMGQALIRAKEVSGRDFNTVFTMQLSIGVLVYLGFFLAAQPFADFFGDPLYADLLRVSALSYFLRPFDYMYSSWLNREMAFHVRTRINLITRVITGVTSVLMALAHWGVWSLVLSGLLAGSIKNMLLARATPLRLRLSLDRALIRRHAGYGSRVVLVDLLGHFTREGVKVMFSKLAGPAFLGLFNKADSLHRLPYWSFGQPLAQPLFRAMAQVQDDLDQTRYLYYRAVTLLMVYVVPFFVVLGWVAQAFIDFVYGPKWSAAGPPLAIMALAGPFYVVMRPCTAVTLAQNRLGIQAMIQILVLAFTLGVCLIGLRWGLAGAAWGFVIAQVFAAAIYYALVVYILPTSPRELLKAVSPGLLLNALLMMVLGIVDRLLPASIQTSPLAYLSIMSLIGFGFYGMAFLLLPIPALASESARWRQWLATGFARLREKRV